ncbi:host attachment family protein [Aliiroseovarius sp. S1339]|uniref:host attachment family protein n=1 Tax=Aliiroseovarius sp. S1339 TaxID=2936990 RepID=UPI0020BFAA78|nr:host attachment family protein [Aliiroseovarius sp. S1339]MCK8462442.1 host attachment family protein [Aliiroseovarius sp. S1339]
MKLKTDTWVVVADGTKYLLLNNVGFPTRLDLRVLKHDQIDVPQTQDLARDRAGRQHERFRPGVSGFKQNNQHEALETAFAKQLVTELNKRAEQKRFNEIVIIADPETLGEMRPAYGAPLKERLVGEIPKDLTNLPIPDIEAVVNAA